MIKQKKPGSTKTRVLKKEKTKTQRSYKTRSNTTKRKTSQNRKSKGIKKTYTLNNKSSKNTLRVIVLGGNEETGGKNMSVIEYNNDIIIIDMGLKFPEDNMHGIDYVIPNISYLKGKEKNIKAVTFTHGHLDHIGAASHLLPQLGNPIVYAPALTAGMLKSRHKEYKNVAPLNIRVIDKSSKIKAGQMEIEFVPVNHSIPDSMAILIHTPVGSLFHTGDYKFDFTPTEGKPSDLGKYALIGEKGLLAMMCDSTDAWNPGHQISEKIVGSELKKIFVNAPKRIIISIVSSNISRIQQIFKIVEELDKLIVLEGRSLSTNVEIAHELGYMKFNPKRVIEAKNIRKYPPEKLVILGTGSQGESNAVLTRVAADDHPYIHFEEDDTVIFSSSVIPGNERSIAKLRDVLYRHGVNIFNYRMMDIHAGGHAKADDHKLMIRLLKPKYFIPVEGSYSFLKPNAMLAEDVGIPKENIFIPDNGQVIEFFKSKQGDKYETQGKITEKRVVVDNVMVDGLGVGDVSNIVMRDRQIMAEDGMFVVIVTIDGQTGSLIGSPDIISRGFVYMKENKELIEGARRKVRGILKKHSSLAPADPNIIKNKIRDDIGLYLFKRTKRRPMVLPVVIEV